MGEYFKLYNKNHGTCIHPHEVGEGLKLGEWLHPNSWVMVCLQDLVNCGIWKRGDKLFAISDYESCLPLNNDAKRNHSSAYDSAPHIKSTHIYKRDFKASWDDETDVPALDRSLLPMARDVLIKYYGPNDWVVQEWD